MNEGRFIENSFSEYKQFHSKRSASQQPGGGCAIFIDKSYNSTELTNISCNMEHIECVFVEISRQNKKLAIGCCYRKPIATNSQHFIDDLVSKIGQIPNNIPLILAGDFNFNLLRIETDRDASSFLGAMHASGLVNTISKPTRVVDNSISLIDNIFISLSLIYSSGIFTWDLSDHFAVFAFLKNIFSTQNEIQNISFRLLNDSTIQNLCDSLAAADYSSIFQSNDIDFSIEKLDSMILEHFDAHCPIIHKNITKKDREKPWINDSLKRLIANRQRFFRMYKSNLISFEAYKEVRNLATNKLKEAKKTYFQNLLDQSKNNMKKMWKVLNGLIKPNVNQNDSCIKSLLVNDQIIDDNISICNSLNEHFSSIGGRISDSFINIPHEIVSPIHIQNSIFFRNINTFDVLQIIGDMQNKSSNIYTYSNRVVKELKHILSPILAHIINNSLQQGYFPSSQKIARVIPLHKGGSKSDINNYRPISILPIFSKIFERIVYNQLYGFLEKYKILSECQYGFRKKRSTTQAVLNQLEFIYSNLDQNKTVISFFMDLSKAFDCIDHDILLKKLYFYGIRGLPHSWFKSYLSNRKQYVNANNVNSSSKSIAYGVPQGSILGPLLFLIFINDFPNINPFFKFCLFADDSTLTCKFDTSNEREIKTRLERELLVVDRWLIMNKLKINYDKSKFIIFSYRKHFSLDTIRFGTNCISSTDSTKFLGIHVDNHLNFKPHVHSICNKISKVIGMLFRLNTVLPLDALKTLYSSLLVPHLLYGIEIWYGILQLNDDMIFKLQKKAIRAVNCLPYNSHTNDYFKSMKLLKLNDLYKQRVLFYMSKSELVLNHQNFHNHETRNVNNIPLPFYRKARTQSTIFYEGINLWNNLPQSIKVIRTEGAFLKSIKSSFLNQY